MNQVLNIDKGVNLLFIARLLSYEVVSQRRAFHMNQTPYVISGYFGSGGYWWIIVQCYAINRFLT